jgi:hypothetical protein
MQLAERNTRAEAEVVTQVGDVHVHDRSEVHNSFIAVCASNAGAHAFAFNPTEERMSWSVPRAYVMNRFVAARFDDGIIYFGQVSGVSEDGNKTYVVHWNDGKKMSLSVVDKRYKHRWFVENRTGVCVGGNGCAQRSGRRRGRTGTLDALVGDGRVGQADRQTVVQVGHGLTDGCLRDKLRLSLRVRTNET